MKKQQGRCNNLKRLKSVYCIASFIAFLGGVAIYAFFRKNNNMALFRFIPRPSFLDSLHIPIQSDSIWSNMFIYNLPYGLWCLSGLLLIRTVWLLNAKWRAIYGGIFIFMVMLYVILKLPGIIPGTFDVLDIIFMGSFAFIEGIIFKLFIRRYL